MNLELSTADDTGDDSTNTDRTRTGGTPPTRTALGPDTEDYTEHEFLEAGGGWYDAAGFWEIVELARDWPNDDDLRAHVRSPSARRNGTLPTRLRAKHLVERHERGEIILLTDAQATEHRAFCERVRARLDDSEGSMGAVWWNGRLTSVTSGGEEVWTAGDLLELDVDALGASNGEAEELDRNKEETE